MARTLVTTMTRKYLGQKKMYATNSSNTPTKQFNKDLNYRKKFAALYPKILDTFTYEDVNLQPVFNDLDYATKYNILNKQFYLGFSVAKAYTMLENEELVTEENLQHANILDWCVEFMLTAVFINDDIMDSAETRWNKPCWYKISNVTLTTAKIMEMAAYHLLAKRFSKSTYYISLVDLFQNSYHMLSMGQSMHANLTLKYKSTLNLEIFTNDVLEKTSKYRNFILNRLPIFSAMLLVYITKPEFQAKMDHIFLLISHLQQAQNDIWDCYGSSGNYGKIGNDIQEGKLTWLIVKALYHATATQLEHLRKDYGRINPNSIKIVKGIYDDLCMLEKYQNYRMHMSAAIIDEINVLQNTRIQKVLRECLKTCHEHDEFVIGLVTE